MKKLLLATALLAAMTAAATAGVINLRLQEDGGSTSDFLGAPGQSSFSAINQPFGDFLISNITGATSPSTIDPVLLSSNTLNIQTTATGAHTLDIWVTGQDLISPTGIVDAFSSFTNVLLSQGWTTTLQTLVSTANLNFTGTLIDQATFNGTPVPTGQSATAASLADFGTGPFSLTAHFTVLTDGVGQANSAISLSAVPGPVVGAGLPGLLGLAGGWWYRRRQKKLVTA